MKSRLISTATQFLLLWSCFFLLETQAYGSASPAESEVELLCKSLTEFSTQPQGQYINSIKNIFDGVYDRSWFEIESSFDESSEDKCRLKYRQSTEKIWNNIFNHILGDGIYDEVIERAREYQGSEEYREAFEPSSLCASVTHDQIPIANIKRRLSKISDMEERMNALSSLLLTHKIGIRSMLMVIVWQLAACDKTSEVVSPPSSEDKQERIDERSPRDDKKEPADEKEPEDEKDSRVKAKSKSKSKSERPGSSDSKLPARTSAPLPDLSVPSGVDYSSDDVGLPISTPSSEETGSFDRSALTSGPATENTLGNEEVPELSVEGLSPEERPAAEDEGRVSREEITDSEETAAPQATSGSLTFEQELHAVYSQAFVGRRSAREAICFLYQELPKLLQQNVQRSPARFQAGQSRSVNILIGGDDADIDLEQWTFLMRALSFPDSVAIEGDRASRLGGLGGIESLGSSSGWVHRFTAELEGDRRVNYFLIAPSSNTLELDASDCLEIWQSIMDIPFDLVMVGVYPDNGRGKGTDFSPSGEFLLFPFVAPRRGEYGRWTAFNVGPNASSLAPGWRVGGRTRDLTPAGSLSRGVDAIPDVRWQGQSTGDEMNWTPAEGKNGEVFFCKTYWKNQHLRDGAGRYQEQWAAQIESLKNILSYVFADEPHEVLTFSKKEEN